MARSHRHRVGGDPLPVQPESACIPLICVHLRFPLLASLQQASIQRRGTGVILGRSAPDRGRMIRPRPVPSAVPAWRRSRSMVVIMQRFGCGQSAAPRTSQSRPRDSLTRLHWRSCAMARSSPKGPPPRSWQTSGPRSRTSPQTRQACASAVSPRCRRFLPLTAR